VTPLHRTEMSEVMAKQTERPVEVLSPLDASFLHLEDGHTSMHIASLAIFEGPAPTHDEVRTALARKLPLVPRYRQRIRAVPLNLGRPVWVDYPGFDIDQHLHRVAVPAPGGEQELQDLMGQLMSRPLDRDLPVWEDWVVDGLPDGRWAMVTKVHHSMADGISGTDLLSTVFDRSRDPEPVPADGWAPPNEPGAVRLAASAVRGRAALPARELAGLARAVRSPRSTARTALGLGRGLVGFAGALLPVGGSSLGGPLHSDRLFRWTEVPLADVAAVRTALGGTVNDVVLAAVARGFRDLLLARGEQPGRHAVRTLVPVSVRLADQHGAPDNRVSAILAELPVEDADPLERLQDVSARMRRLKASHEAEAGQVVTELADLIPPVALASALHVAFRVPHRFLNTVTTNVPGPRSTLWFAGRRMLASYPYVPLADRVRMGVAVTSYEGRLLFGITADAASSPDVDVLVRGLEDGFRELEKVVQEAEATP
jgi:diacylglycerol O-acyltransferase / wax synthase